MDLGPGDFQYSDAGPSAPSYAQPLSSPDKPWSSAPTSGEGLPSQPPADTAAAAQTSTPIVIRRVGGKANVSQACGPCKKAHLACDVGRPCQRCQTMNRVDACVEVPHKKRGRPKMPKPPMREAYQRSPMYGMSTSMPAGGRWPSQPYGQQSFEYLPYPPPSTSSGSLSVSGPSSFNSRGPSPPRSAGEVSMRPPAVPQTPFEVFCSTSLQLVRATAACQAMTGYQLHQVLGAGLLDIVHPADRPRVEYECNLLVNPFGGQALSTSKEAETLMLQRAERDLMSPAPGMKEPYPHVNVRLIRSDNTFAWFNMRLHFGGALGASLYQPESLDKIYIVASFLYLSHFEEAGRGPGAFPPFPPPTPLSAPSAFNSQPQTATMHPWNMNSANRALPSFSSFAATAEGIKPKAEWNEAPIPSPTVPMMPNSATRPTYGWTGYAKREPSPSYAQPQPQPIPAPGYYQRPVEDRQESFGFQNQGPMSSDEDQLIPGSGVSGGPPMESYGP